MRYQRQHTCIIFTVSFYDGLQINVSNRKYLFAYAAYKRALLYQFDLLVRCLHVIHKA